MKLKTKMSVPKIIGITLFFFLFIMWLGLINGATKTLNEDKPLLIGGYSIIFDHSHKDVAVVFEKGDASVGDTILVKEVSEEVERYFVDKVTETTGDQVLYESKSDNTVVLGKHYSESVYLGTIIYFFGSTFGVVVGIAVPVLLFLIVVSLLGKKAKKIE